MRTSTIETVADMQWLREVHGAPSGYILAFLHGNDDYPEKILLYARDHYLCKPTVMERNESGDLVVTQLGETP